MHVKQVKQGFSSHQTPKISLWSPKFVKRSAFIPSIQPMNITLAIDKLEVMIHFTWISQFPLDRNHFSGTTGLLMSAPYLWFRKVVWSYFNQRQVLTELRGFLMIIQLIARKTFKVAECFLSNKRSGVKAYKWLGVLDSVSRGPSSGCVEVIRTIYTKDETKSYLRRAIS